MQSLKFIHTDGRAAFLAVLLGMVRDEQRVEEKNSLHDADDERIQRIHIFGSVADESGDLRRRHKQRLQLLDVPSELVLKCS